MSQVSITRARSQGQIVAAAPTPARRAASPRRPRAPVAPRRRRRRAAQAAPRRPSAFRPVGRAPFGGARRSATVVADGRALRLHRQCLCRRRQGADHARMSPARSSPSMSSRASMSRSAIRLFDIDPAPYRDRAALAQGQARRGEGRIRQSAAVLREQSGSDHDGRGGGRAPPGRLRPQARAAERRKPARASMSTRPPAALVQAKQILEFVQQQQATTAKVKLGGGPDALDRDVSRLYAGEGGGRRRRAQPRQHASSSRRSPASPRRSTRSSSAASRRPGSRCSRSSPTAGFGSTPTRRNPISPTCTPGLAATVTVDAFPDREWRGKVCSIAPGTGAQFAILPPQNASGNWVKVVQRVPLRVLLRRRSGHQRACAPA